MTEKCALKAFSTQCSAAISAEKSIQMMRLYDGESFCVAFRSIDIFNFSFVFQKLVPQKSLSSAQAKGSVLDLPLSSKFQVEHPTRFVCGSVGSIHQCAALFRFSCHFRS